MKLNKSDPIVDFGPEPFTEDGAAVLAALKFGAQVFTYERVREVADGFESQWGKARAMSALTEVIKRVEAITGTGSARHGSDPGELSREDSTLPATEADRQFRSTLRKGQIVAIVSRRPLDDGRIRIVVTHEKLVAIRQGTIRAKTKVQGRSARLTCGILLVYSTNKFPTELKRTFNDEEELNAWFSDLEAKEEEEMMAADKTLDLKTWRAEARRGTPCEFHRLHAGNQRIIQAKILEPAKKGARVQTDGGDFFFERWTDLYPRGWLEIQPETPKTLGKLGDVIDFQAAIKAPSTSQTGKATFALVPDSKAPSVPIPPAKVRPPVPAMPAPPARIVPPPTPEPFSRRKERAPMRRPKEHHLTAIGHIFRAERLKRAMHQRDVAQKLGFNRQARDICDIELGDVMPDDDTLLHFSEAFSVDLDLLLSARDGKQDTAADPVSAMKQIASLEAKLAEDLVIIKSNDEAFKERTEQLRDERRLHAETRAGVLAAEARVRELEDKLDKATMPWDAQALQAINEFIGRLTAVSPLPTEPEKRHAWYEAALKMFGAGK